MKPEHERYISENIRRKSAEAIAEDLGIKERKIKKFLEKQKNKDNQSAVSSQTPSCKRNVILSVFLIIVLGFAVYANSLDGEFLWDDEHLIENNSLIRGWSNVKYVFSNDIGAGAGRNYTSYRPMQTLAYMADYALGGLDVRAYHLTNVLLHILVGLSLYWFIRLLFKDNRLSLLTAILYIIHPVHTEAVAYISGTADPLALLFMLLCFIFYIKRLSSRRSGLYWLMMGSYVLALLSRENSIILPALLLLYHYSFKKKIIVKEFSSIVALAVSYILLRVTVLKGLLSDGAVSTTTLLERLPGFFVALANYIKLLFFPFPLHMEYGGRLFSAGDPKVILGVALFLILLGGAFWKKKDKPLVFFCVLWFFMALLPVSNLYPINAYMAEHWLYVPSIGFFLLTAKVIISLYEREGLKTLTTIFVLGYILFFSFLTIRQNAFWSKPLDFYQMTLKYVSDSPRVYYNLGIIYAERGRQQEAMEAFQKAIELKPDYTDAHGNLGNVYKDMKMYKEAVALYERVLKMDPMDAVAYYNLGYVYNELGQQAKAIDAYKVAIQLMPNYAGAYNNLGEIFEKMGNEDIALEAYRKAVGFRPDYALAHDHLATIYFRRGQYPLAIKYYDEASKFGSVNDELRKSLKPYRTRK